MSYPVHTPPTGPMLLRRGYGAWAAARAAQMHALPAALDARFGALHASQASALAGLAQAPLHRDPLPMWLADALTAVGFRPYDLVDGIALLPVTGLIVPEAGFIGAQDATGCAELTWQIGLAQADDDVRGVALMVDSGGGYTTGVDACAAAIRATEKPVAAIVTGAAYSAAMWLAAAADSIAVDRTGGVGSIGVIVEHWDDTAMLERMGIDRTVIARGERKADLHPSLTDQGRAALEALVGDLRGVFAASVADYRGITAEAVLATESRWWDGPTQLAEAQTLGLIDAIASPSEALRAFAGFVAAAQPTTAAQPA